jgi:hypothetical protein
LQFSIESSARSFCDEKFNTALFLWAGGTILQADLSGVQALAKPMMSKVAAMAAKSKKGKASMKLKIAAKAKAK